MTRKTAEIVSVVLAELEARYAAEAASAVAGCLAQENLGLNLETSSVKELDSLVYSEDASKELAASTDCLISSVLESGWPKNPSPILDVGYQPHLGPGAAL